MDAAPAPLVTLRPVTASDLPDFFAQQADPEAATMVRFTPRDYEACILHWQRSLGEPHNLARTIEVDSRPVGHIVAFERDGVREVGYWLDRAAWGRGVATAALRLFLTLETTRPLHAGTAPHNTRSQRVLRKCGFAPAGHHDGFDLFVLTD